MLTVLAEFFYLNSACQGLSKYKRKYLAQTGHVNLISGQSEKSDKRPISVGVSSPIDLFYVVSKPHRKA